MGGEIDEISAMLGEIKGRVRAIEEQQKEERLTSAQHRYDLRIVIASQSTALQGMSSKLESPGVEMKALAGDVAEMKVLTNEYRENRDQARGAAKVVLFFRGLVLFLSAAVGSILTYLGLGHGK